MISDEVLVASDDDEEGEERPGSSMLAASLAFEAGEGREGIRSKFSNDVDGKD